MKILVTGSAGHLGEAIIRLLISQNIAYRGIDIKSSPFTTSVGSIYDGAFVDAVMQDIDIVLHTATLHKPHVVTHSRQDFVDTNITGTLNLLEAAARNRIQAFVYTSTTSTFGDVLTPSAGEPAVWIDEDSPSSPKNIYGVTKSAAEDLCQLFHRNHGLPCIVLKTSRFFPEADDKKSTREMYADANLKANELLYRRVDIEDAATAHFHAMHHAKRIGFARYVISATSPFTYDMLPMLNRDARAIVEELYPKFRNLYEQHNWKMLPAIDRVYSNKKAIADLQWRPKYDFGFVLDCLASGKDYRSGLSLLVGSKGYHSTVFENGPYPVAEN